MNKANINSLWADLMVEELIRLGIDYFCISPGSRSTPLAAAIATRNETGRWSGNVSIHFDERGAAFHALGYARATGKPAVLVCTSGTAAANYYPAVIEASQDNIPLIALTADRPPELRNTGANQTIDQLHLYGRYARWFYDLPCPDDKADGHDLVTIIDRAVAKAQSPPAGPVHLNCPFREPLAPTSDGSDLSKYAEQLNDWYDSGKPLNELTPHSTKPSHEQLAAATELVAKTKEGLLLVGRLDTDRQRQALVTLSEKLGWPLLADVTSGLRFSPSESVTHHYDLLLASEEYARTVQPEAVIHFGGRFVSKRLLEFLEHTAPESFFHINDSPDNLDPARCVTDRIVCDIPLLCEGLLDAVPLRMDHAYLSRWQRANEIARQIISEQIDNATELTEAAVARHISQHLEDNTGLFVASSMPVRDLDMFAGINENSVRVASDRGASGIDGTIASATGFAAGLERPVTLLTGDLAFLHDLNSLALLGRSPRPITVIVLNNDGGGIFQHLPVADLPDIFEKYFVTPHGLSFASAAEMFDLPHFRTDDMSELKEAYRLSQQSERSTIIEVALDRRIDLSLHRSVQSEIVKALKSLN